MVNPFWGRVAEHEQFLDYTKADEDGIFVAEIPSLPGCISPGASRSEALSNIREAIEAYLESLKTER